MNIVTAYESFDGKLFHTKEQCLKHEVEKKKYPLTKLIETDIEGDLGLKKIEVRVYKSRSNFQKIKSYYQLPNQWKFECVTTVLHSAYNKELIGREWYYTSLSEFIVILYNKFPNIEYNDLISYLKYFYNGKQIIGHHYLKENPYDIGNPIYGLISFEEAICKPLPDYIKVTKKENSIKIWDSRHYLGVTIFK